MLSYNYICSPEIQQMLKHFHIISGLRVGIHDPEMNIISEYPQKSSDYNKLCFCDKIRYYSDPFTERCRKCDLYAFEHIRITKKTYIYTCHSGFLEAIIPILHKDQIICALMIGQVQNAVIQEPLYEKIISFLLSYQLSDVQLTDIHTTFHEMPVMNRTYFESYVYFLEMCAQSIYENRYIRVAEKTVVENFKEYVQMNLYDNINVRQAAIALNVSVSHLSRLIARDLGMSFTEYITQQRIHLAEEILLSSSFSVNDIAYMLHFNDPAYFMRVFKKKTGMTCTEFRKTHK